MRPASWACLVKHFNPSLLNILVLLASYGTRCQTVSHDQ